MTYREQSKEVIAFEFLHHVRLCNSLHSLHIVRKLLLHRIFDTYILTKSNPRHIRSQTRGLLKTTVASRPSSLALP